MADSKEPCPSSSSESDSDREPNSRGARVFWGNIQTPEKSQSAFVDPPHTVIRTHQPLHTQTVPKSPALTIPVENSGFSPSILQMVGEDGTLVDPTHPNNVIATGPEKYQETHGLSPPDLQRPSDGDNPASLSDPQTSSPPLQTTKTSSLESGSENEIERDPALQLASPVDALSPPELTSQEPSDASSQPTLSVTPTAVPPFAEPPVAAEPREPRAPELPDLISFDIPTRPRTNIPGFPHTSSSLTPLSQLSSSSSTTVDDLLSFSPTLSETPLGQFRLSESHHNDLEKGAAVSASPSTPKPEGSHQEQVKPCSSQVEVATNPPTPKTTASPHRLPSTNDIGASSSGRDAPTSKDPSDTGTAHPSPTEDRPATPHFNALNEGVTPMPKPALDPIPSPSRGETRKRSPAKGSNGKEKAHNDVNCTRQSSNNTAGEIVRSLGHGEEYASDVAARKERRAKSKREVERTRQQLLSLSPTSAMVLNLLASPGRGSPPGPFPSIGPDEAASDLAMDSDLPNRSNHVGPDTPQRDVTRRAPISASSRRRSEGSPLRFVAPSPINLNDINRSPARRILVPFDARAPRPLPLDDPNRTPARRVARPPPPPTILAERSEPLTPRIRIEESYPAHHAMQSPEKSSIQPASLSSASLLPATDASRPLPFPIRQNVTGSRTVVLTSIRPSRPNTDSTTTKQPSESKLRQPSSTSTSRIARIAAKPYSRPAQGPSRLPVTASSRGPPPVAGTSSISSTNSAGPSRPYPLPANPVPSRIPSPTKPSTPFVRPTIEESSVAPASTSTNVNSAEEKSHSMTSYKRKRQRMISEDDPDEPPAKRHVIVRPVIKGMYNKASTNPEASQMTVIHRDTSPVRPLRLLGPIQVRPVIPGTLRHYETTRSSSRDLLNDAEQGNDSHLHSIAPEFSRITVDDPPSESREDTPLVDTDTGSTVTTLSREPTLDELPVSSAPRSATHVPTELSTELRRTTRFRKPSGPDTPGMPSASTTAYKRNPVALVRTTSMIQHPGPNLSSKGSSRSTTRTGATGAPQEGLPINPRQLQALTDANTLHNQAYFADLQRKIVRRYGPRPASPTTKIRTIQEKSREERAKEREARAERRRRRDEGSNLTASSEGDYMDVPSSPTPETQPSESGPLTKHVRGPGDEEDYETPVRSPKPGQIDPNKVAKTVKWDRGLARTISDWAAKQLTIEANKRAEAEAIRKGCLARDPTTLRLDPLGNVPNAKVPLEDLGRERVVVTRFVYDDDVEASRVVKKKKT